jgi:hypothetical protein
MKLWIVLFALAALVGWRVHARGNERYYLAPGEEEPAVYYDNERSLT